MENTSYEEIPYESKPHYPMHPDCLGTLGLLFGMNPAPASRCRVLELGCATGMNVICLAEALPESEFVGIDLSPTQIAVGQELASRAGLKNVKLHAASILDLDESWGQFDFIMSHGVFSWVPTIVQERIFELSRKLLKPNGIAYISYNTYPGWHLRATIRDLMRYHSSSFTDPVQQIEQSRALLQFMANSAPDQTSSYSRLLAKEAEALSHAPDSYVFHELLEEVNTPLYFHQFMERASQHQLQYLSEAWQHTVLDELPAEVRDALHGISRDLIALEQYADFLTNKTFRRTLLCHSAVELNRAPPDYIIHALHVSALAEPTSAALDVRSTEPMVFKLEHGATVNVNFPIVKAALARLYEVWPRSMPFEQLLAEALQTIAVPVAEGSQQRDILSSILLRGHLAHFVALHREPFVFTANVSQQPEVNVLARLLAARSSLVPSRRHKLVPIQQAERGLLSLADGTRNQAALVAEYAAVTNTESLPVARESLTDWVAASLQRFARQGLLVK